MDSYENAKDYYRAGESIEGPQSLSQRSTGREESNRDSQLDRNTMRESGRVKREATITARLLRPRYLRTYARPAPVNRAKEARLRLDRGHGFDEEDCSHEKEKEKPSAVNEKLNIVELAGSCHHQGEVHL